jgi:hypothetical protein
VLRVLDAITEHDKLEVKRIKNRLMLEYNAQLNGGYRDLLINVAIRETGHIFEIQVTLESLMEIKTDGGHALYGDHVLLICLFATFVQGLLFGFAPICCWV